MNLMLLENSPGGYRVAMNLFFVKQTAHIYEVK